MSFPPISTPEGGSKKPNFSIIVHEIANEIVPSSDINRNALNGGPGGFSMAKANAEKRKMAIEKLINFRPTFNIGIVADATRSMNGDVADVRENVSPWLVNTLIQTAQSTLNIAKAALHTGLSEKLSPFENSQLMKEGIQLKVTIAATGDSRTDPDDDNKTLIDDPPIDIFSGNTTVKLSNTSEELEGKARQLLQTITNYSPTKFGGGNTGESIPEGLVVVAGINGQNDKLLPLIGSMIAHYEKYGNHQKINELLTYLRALSNLGISQPVVNQPVDILVAITDEPPPDSTIVSMPQFIRAIEGRKTPLYVITTSSYIPAWKANTNYQDAKLLDLKTMCKDGQTIQHPLFPAIEDGMQKAVVNSLKLLTG